MTQSVVPANRAKYAMGLRPPGAPADAIAVDEGQVPAKVAEFIANMAPKMQAALPAHLNADRMARLALNAVRKSVLQAAKSRSDKHLANCTPESFAGALLYAAALGLEPDVMGEAYLVPYKGEVTLIIGYQGYAKLFWQHPLAQTLVAEAVYQGDEFDFHRGLHPNLTHRPWRQQLGGERGKVTDYYAAASLRTGAEQFVVLSADEVYVLRGGKQGPSGDIKDPQLWMERKTALRQLFKLLPKSPQLALAVQADEVDGRELLNDLPSVPAIEANPTWSDPDAPTQVTRPRPAPTKTPPAKAADAKVEFPLPTKPTKEAVEALRVEHPKTWGTALTMVAGAQVDTDQVTADMVRRAMLLTEEQIAEFQADQAAEEAGK